MDYHESLRQGSGGIITRNITIRTSINVAVYFVLHVGYNVEQWPYQSQKLDQRLKVAP